MTSHVLVKFCSSTLQALARTKDSTSKYNSSASSICNKTKKNIYIWALDMTSGPLGGSRIKKYRIIHFERRAVQQSNSLRIFDMVTSVTSSDPLAEWRKYSCYFNILCSFGWYMLLAFEIKCDITNQRGWSRSWLYLPNTGHNKHFEKRSLITITGGTTISEFDIQRIVCRDIFL
jgi:hypothetical protein